MIGIVRTALRRPYTFVVMAMLILLFGVGAAFRTPIDIFPSINIPVVAVVFSYTGLPPDDMAGRVVTFYERALTTSVNDIEHIESQSIPNYGIIKIFFQPSVNINAALAEVAAMSQTVLKQLPAGITPPTILSFDASSVPVLQIALSSKKLSETTLYDDASSFIRPQLASVAGAAIPLPYGGKVRQVQADLNQQALHTYGISANDVVNALAIQNLITPVGTEKVGKLEKPLTRISLVDSLLIGIAQAFALIPGVSRSGSTITAGLFRGLTREAAVRFSFLLSTPLIAGAALLKAHELHKEGLPLGMQMPVLVGIIVSALVGYAAIAWLIHYLQSNSLRVFIVYRIVAGVVVIVLAFAWHLQ